MGKGDIKTRKGKIANGSYGARRTRKSEMVAIAPIKAEAAKPEKKTATKAKKAQVPEMA